MSEQSNITIYYDDQLPDVMNKINKELLQLGVQIQNDCAPHDGFEVYYLETVHKETEGVVTTVAGESVHPWTGMPGYSQLHITGVYDENVSREVDRLIKEGWHPWIVGRRGDLPAAVMYRPFPYDGKEWEDHPYAHKRQRENIDEDNRNSGK